MLVSADKMTWPHINFVFKLTNKKINEKEIWFLEKRGVFRTL